MNHKASITALTSSFGRAFHAENVSRAGKRRYENFLFKWRHNYEKHKPTDWLLRAEL